MDHDSRIQPTVGDSSASSATSITPFNGALSQALRRGKRRAEENAHAVTTSKRTRVAMSAEVAELLDGLEPIPNDQWIFTQVPPTLALTQGETLSREIRQLLRGLEDDSWIDWMPTQLQSDPRVPTNPQVMISTYDQAEEARRLLDGIEEVDWEQDLEDKDISIVQNPVQIPATGPRFLAEDDVKQSSRATSIVQEPMNLEEMRPLPLTLEEPNLHTTASPEPSSITRPPLPPRARLPIIMPTATQQSAIDAILRGESVFLTGPAGSGKSYILNTVCRRFPPGHVTALTAMTGMAARIIGGCTLHSFLGTTFDTSRTHSQVWDAIKRRKGVVERIASVQTLVIDEVGSLSPTGYLLSEYLVKMARQLQARRLRKDRGDLRRELAGPWGGCQVVFVGDFHQLPPVIRDLPRHAPIPWLFTIPQFITNTRSFFSLPSVLRQQDKEFVHHLDQIRRGIVNDETDAYFRRLPSRPPSGSHVTRLFARNEDVYNYNEKMMGLLRSLPVTYEAVDVFEPERAAELRDLPVEETVTLKVGCVVMLVKNLDNILVNGTTGTVIGFGSSRTFDSTFPDEPAHFNVKARGTVWPIVRWEVPGMELEEMVIEPCKFEVEAPSREMKKSSRRQLPIVLAYALTIHKSQGQTLDRVWFNAKDCYAYGQAYVALSRVRTVYGLYIENWSRSCVRADPQVIAWTNGQLREKVVKTENRIQGKRQPTKLATRLS